MKRIKSIIAAGLVALATALPAQAQYRAVEVTPTTDDNFRTRVVANVGVPNTPIRYHGLHEITDDKVETYGGLNFLSAGNDHAHLGVQFRSNKDELHTPRIGVRNHSLIKNVADYGWIEGSADDKSINIRGLLGYVLPRSFGLELASNQTFRENAKPFNWSEIQLYKWNEKGNLGITGRVEIPNFKTKEAIGLVGVIYKF
jgi:hypothetical protein